jgi:replication-associated recombination protein RarA
MAISTSTTHVRLWVWISALTSTAIEREPTPAKIFDVPELLSPYFTGRDEELTRIGDVLAAARSDVPVRCVVYGIPGQGKTQLALWHAKDAFDQKRRSYVFWISGATTEKASEGFARVASLLHLPRCSDMTQAEKAELAKGWLEHRSVEAGQRRKWLLVVDNVDASAAGAINNLLPRSNPGGQILITTRTMETARRMSHMFGSRYVQLELQKLGLDDSAQLLCKWVNGEHSMSDDIDMKHFEEVANTVGCLPLAISQAASFMEISGQSPEDFLTTFKNETEEVGLIKSKNACAK